ncbi:hypothetical protein M8C21_016946, partial [Ambrosia artemisiifolia]
MRKEGNLWSLAMAKDHPRRRQPLADITNISIINNNNNMSKKMKSISERTEELQPAWAVTRLQSELMDLMVSSYSWISAFPPTVKFETKCFHPNVDRHGNLCFCILEDNWSCAYSVQTILIIIHSLLEEPNTSSPMNDKAAALWSNQPGNFWKRIIKTVSHIKDLAAAAAAETNS